MHNRGLLDKYMGDAVMAVFGAPKHYPEHALMACRTALNMMSRLKELNAQWADMGRPPLNIGVGVNTGHMVAGNMGSQDRFDYTVMGDHVNLGSRLEGLNKVYGTNIIISEFTLAAVGEEYHVRSLDMVRVKGKDSAVKIFELLGPAGEPCPLEYLEQYEKGMTAYRKGDFSRAQEIFSDIQRTTPSDTVVALYLERLKHLQTDPPTSWDGVYTFTTK
jgi:adenylate cyclase